jgi:hypothetical protein
MICIPMILSASVTADAVILLPAEASLRYAGRLDVLGQYQQENGDKAL